MRNALGISPSHAWLTNNAVQLGGTLLVACANSSPATASGSGQEVDYSSNIDLLSELNRPITQSLLPKHVKYIDCYPDNAIFPYTRWVDLTTSIPFNPLDIRDHILRNPLIRRPMSKKYVGKGKRRALNFASRNNFLEEYGV